MPSKKKAKRVSRSDGWNRYSRFYVTPEGAKYPSVTTVLSAVNKPALVPWAAKEERKLVLGALRKLMDSLPKERKTSRLQFMGMLDDAIGEQKAHARILQKAGNIGTEIHHMTEWGLRRELKQEVGPEPVLSDEASSGFVAWDDWRQKVNLVPYLIEETVYSDKYGYAGTLDLFCEMDLPPADIDGKPTGLSGRGKVMTDWKSGKGIYTEARLQTAAYMEALIEMGHAPQGIHGLVVRVPKVIGDPDVETGFITSSDSKRIFKAFLATLELWKYLDTVPKK
jgi:hypothetical protein